MRRVEVDANLEINFVVALPILPDLGDKLVLRDLPQVRLQLCELDDTTV